jgi:hypothetical protein
MKFKVAVMWVMSGIYTVEADTLEKAQEKVLDAEPPYAKLPRGGYVDESMRIDHVSTDELNG